MYFVSVVGSLTFSNPDHDSHSGSQVKKGYTRNVCDFSQDDTDIFLRYQFFKKATTLLSLTWKPCFNRKFFMFFF